MNVIGRLMCQCNESCVLIGPGVNAVSIYIRAVVGMTVVVIVIVVL
jgi:hypothetical protein